METATEAGFLPFELVDPIPDESRISGFGGGSDRSLHADITHIVGGRTLTVATATGATEHDEDLLARRLVMDAVESIFEERLVFPLSLSLRFEERASEVSVNGSPVTFRGIVAVGTDGFALRARVGADTLITIVAASDLLPIAIRRRKDLTVS